MPDEVWNPNEKQACPCGCGAIGIPRVRRSRDGKYHVRNCGKGRGVKPCRSCAGRRARNNSSRRERELAVAIPNGAREMLSGAVSGFDVGCPWLVYEETAHVRLVGGLRRWWERAEIQKKTARILAADLPGAFVASWDGRRRLVVQSWEGHQRLLKIIEDLTRADEGVLTGLPAALVHLKEEETR